jgi:hypothetical protein
MNKLFSKSILTLVGSVSAVALVLWVGLSLQGCGDGNGFFKNLTLCDVPQDTTLNSLTRIGGSSTVVTLETLGGSSNWTIYNVANDLRATQVGVTESAKYILPLAGFIMDVDVIEYPAASGAYYALVSMGDKGITVVNVTDPANMTVVNSVGVNYYQDGIIFAEGGGSIVPDVEISGIHAPIDSLAVYNDASGVDQLIIADEAYGLHKTKLANLFDTVAGREVDGTLLIDSEKYTLQYAGENPWGGPKSLNLYKNPSIVDDKGTLFVAMGFMGMGIFNPETLEQVGRYNLYTDPDSKEDWFVKPDPLDPNLDVATQVSSDPADPTDLYLDDFTGMPDYRQASYEITEIWHNKLPCPDTIPFVDVVGCAPWAAFDRYGKHYYDARKVDVATFASNGKTIAYIAYALGGVVAVDVTDYKDALPYDPANADPFAGFLTATYMGYVPAVPANGPDAPTGEDSKSLFPHFGSGMLKEAGILDVKVDIPGNRVYFSDHFAGLVAIGNADDPSTWHGPGPLPYDNDILEPYVLGDHWPDYEFISSYDMTPHDVTDNESLPEWMYQSPTLLVTGEVNGHGNSFMLMPGIDTTAASTGQVDIIAASGGGGINFVDITDINNSATAATDDGFSVLVHMATTDVLFREADGSISPDGLSIGHSAGVDSYRNLLFLADGPHGMTVWKIADEERCFPLEDILLLANTLQDEYPVDTGTEVINPTPHAYDVILDEAKQNALVMSQSRGLRRVGLGSLAGADASSIPLLLKPALSDIYEHNTTEGSVGGLRMQDHVYDVALDGNLAFVADGSNGITVYDLSKDPTVDDSFLVGNIGGETTSQPSLGHATAVALWKDTSDANNIKTYAFVAAGHAGVGVVDVTNPAAMQLVKVFEPIKIEEGKYGKADGRSVDVMVVDDHVYFSYDSFGMVAYTIADLIKPLPEGMDPTDIWEPNTIGERPEAVARFRLSDSLLGGSDDLADLGGGALGMFYQALGDKHYFYVAYGTSGAIKIDWTDVTKPMLVGHVDTAGEAGDIEVISGRAYVADGAGGLVIIK